MASRASSSGFNSPLTCCLTLPNQHHRAQSGEFQFQGPNLSNLVLADEINRAPAKVQSALLEAMAERQISVGNETRALPELLLVMATQNPIEQEGLTHCPKRSWTVFCSTLWSTIPMLTPSIRFFNWF